MNAPALAAIAVPAALAIGIVAELVSGAVRAVTPSERPWWAGVATVWRDGRRLVARRETASLAELGGLLAALAGAGLAAGAAIGTIPGSAPLVYLALLLAAAGVHVAASTPTTRAQDERMRRVRMAAALVEPAFVGAIGAAFLRWGAVALEAIRGNQSVLGPGIALAPPVAAVGLGLAALTFLVAGAARLVPAMESRRGPGRGAGSALATTVARWAAMGATAIVAAVLVSGGELPPASTGDLFPMIAGLVACTVAIGLADGLLSIRPAGSARLFAVPALLVAAAGAAALVTLA